MNASARSDAKLTTAEAEAIGQDIERLVTAALDGDQDAWASLVDRFSGRLWAVVRGFSLSEADATDAIQTTWLLFFQHAHRLRDRRWAGAWLATTARHECLRLLRRRGREVLVDDEISFERPDLADSPEEIVIRIERDAMIWDAIDALPDRYRMLMRELTSEDAPSYEEIGKALDMPVGSIGPTRGRCIERLRRSPEIAREMELVG